MAAVQVIATVQESGPGPRTDELAWITEAYEAYAGELEVYVGRKFGNGLAPKDVVHEAFARLVRDVSAGRAPLLVRPWLYRVAHNLAVDELRRPIRFEPDEGHEAADEASSCSAEADFELASLSPELRQALRALSRASRTSILMAADGYTGREIATTIGRSEPATRTLLCRTRRALRGTLGGPRRLPGAGSAPWLAA